MTSVSGDTFTVFDVFESVTVMLFAVTEEISVSCTGGGVAFFFALANDGAARPHINRAQIRNRSVVFIESLFLSSVCYFLYIGTSGRVGGWISSSFSSSSSATFTGCPAGL